MSLSRALTQTRAIEMSNFRELLTWCLCYRESKGEEYYLHVILEMVILVSI